MDLDTLKSMGGTWLRASLAAVIALYLNGETDPKKLAAAFVAGIAGPAMKFLNPKDPAYGLGAAKALASARAKVEEALAAPAKKPAKKATKKTAKK